MFYSNEFDDLKLMTFQGTWLKMLNFLKWHLAPWKSLGNQFYISEIKPARKGSQYCLGYVHDQLRHLCVRPT